MQSLEVTDEEITGVYAGIGPEVGPLLLRPRDRDRGSVRCGRIGSLDSYMKSEERKGILPAAAADRRGRRQPIRRLRVGEKVTPDVTPDRASPRSDRGAATVIDPVFLYSPQFLAEPWAASSTAAWS